MRFTFEKEAGEKGLNLKEYLGRYESLQRAIRADEKLLRLVEASQSSLMLSRIREEGSFSSGGKDSLSEMIFDSAALKQRLAHRNRLYERYALRIKEAVVLMKSPSNKSYIIWRYLYGFNAEKIAEINNYSERHIYRKAQLARRQLYLALLQVMPRRKEKGPPKRYTVTGGKGLIKKYIRPGMIPRVRKKLRA